MKQTRDHEAAGSPQTRGINRAGMRGEVTCPSAIAATVGCVDAFRVTLPLSRPEAHQPRP